MVIEETTEELVSNNPQEISTLVGTKLLYKNSKIDTIYGEENFDATMLD